MNKFIIFLAATLLAMQSVSAWAVDVRSSFSKRSAVFYFAERCELLNPSQLLAVKSGQLQARGALLRSGLRLVELDQMSLIAQQSVTDIDCANAEALAEIELVKSSHDSWLNIHRITYPATYRQWNTSRDMALTERRWRVWQNIEIDENLAVRFGATTLDGQHSLDLVIENQVAPRSVLLRMRDPAKLERPPNVFLRKLLKLPLDGVPGLAPPDSATQTHFATGRRIAEIGLLTQEKDTIGVRFGFGEEILAVFSHLDPREAISVDLYWSAGLGKPDRHQRLFVEVGDFLAARMFAEAKD